jgi:integrase
MTECVITESDIRLTCLQRGLRESTITSYLVTFRTLELLDRPITLLDVVKSLQSVKNPNTRRKHVLVLKSMLPFDLPIKSGSSVPRQYYLPTQDEYEFYRALFAYPERLDLMYYAGLRVGEACYNHDVVGNLMTVRYQISATGSVEPAKTVGSVVVPTWLNRKLPQWQGSSNRLSVAIGRHSKRVGIPLTAHGLRASYATRLVEAGIPLVGLQQQLRHASVSTTLTHYVQIQQSELTTLIERL